MIARKGRLSKKIVSARLVTLCLSGLRFQRVMDSRGVSYRTSTPASNSTTKRRRILSMAKQNVDNLNVTCPCCHSKLVVDSVFGAVLSHEAPPKTGPNVDLTDAAGILNEQQRNREDKFRDSWNLEHNKEDILAKKFEEAMKKAKDAPAGKPLRDIDLD
jgi:hypothetical protein